MTKRFIIFSLLFLLPVLSFADSLTCQTELNGGFLILEKVYAECEDGYSISLEGFGAVYPFRFAKECIKISCPFQSEIAGNYFGVKASAGVVGHASGALFIGEGFCFVGGLGLGGGTSVSIPLLAIEKWGILFNAIATGNIEKLERQITLFKDEKNIKDGEGNTPLTTATAVGTYSILTRIIEWEKSRLNPSEWRLYIKTPNNDGDTPLMYIAGRGGKDILRSFIEEGEDVNRSNNDGMTALMYAATNNRVDSMRILIENGAEVNAATKRDSPHWGGATALMYAAFDSHEFAVQLLINSGADVNIENAEGWTALDYALLSSNRNNHVIKMLRDAGGVCRRWCD